jgi:hypothetical protein
MIIIIVEKRSLIDHSVFLSTVQGDDSTGHFEQDTRTSRSRSTLMFAMNREAINSSPSEEGSQQSVPVHVNDQFSGEDHKGLENTV